MEFAQQLKDWAFTLTTSILYYHDYDSIDEGTRNLYRKAMAAFGGDRAQLPHRAAGKADDLLGLPLAFAGYPDDVQLHAGWTRQDRLRLCKHCQKVFMSSRANAVFCSARCKNQYNVYKSRGKQKEQDGDENA